MELFYTTKDLSFNFAAHPDQVLKYNFHGSEKPKVENIYACTAACIGILSNCFQRAEGLPKDFSLMVLNEANKRQIYGLSDFPTVLSNFPGWLEETSFIGATLDQSQKIPPTEFIPLENKIEKFKNKKEITVFILNGMGSGLGDTIVGLTALNVLYEKLKEHFKKVIIDIGPTPISSSKGHRSLCNQLNKKSHNIRQTRLLPIPLIDLFKYDLVVDYSCVVLRENFNNQPMIDFYLENMGIDPKTVPSEHKIPFVKNDLKVSRNLQPLFDKIRKDNPNRKLVLLSPKASGEFRTMPDLFIKEAVNAIIDNGDVLITCHGWNSSSKIFHERHIDISEYSKNIESFVSIISQMDKIISCDTSTYHISAAFNIPTIVFFASINPEYRIKYYPNCTGISINQDESLDGMHLSFETKFIKAAEHQWLNYLHNNDLSEIFS